jgi:predicted DNA-binding ribbon-helix-helix protein
MNRPKRPVGRPRKDSPQRPQKTSITLPGDKWMALKHVAVERRVTVSKLLTEAIDHIIRGR